MAQVRYPFDGSLLNTPEDFLNEVKTRCDVRSDYQVAIRLGISHQAVSRYRKGLSGFDENTSLKIAELLRIRPEFVLTKMAAFRSPTDQTREAWRRASEEIQKAMKKAKEHGWRMIATAAIGVGAATLGVPSPVAAGQLNNNGIVASGIHIVTISAPTPGFNPEPNA